MPISPTPEQQAIVEAVKSSTDSLMVTAYAGCAKTTTLTLIAVAQVARDPSTKGLALAFNVRIKKELETRLPSEFSCLTLNGIGHRVWGQTLGKRLELDSNKINRLVSAVSNTLESKELWQDIRSLALQAMMSGMIPQGYPDLGLIPDTLPTWRELAEDLDRDPRAIPYARQVLTNSVKESFKGLISFDDQIYMSALFSTPSSWPKFSFVMVDEAQDLSPLNHLQIRALKGARLVVVGDPKQAIYAWRGADSASMQTMQSLAPAWQHFPLTTTFRCPKLIVERQKFHAPGFRAAPSAPQGEITTWENWNFLDLPKGQTAILCRNNAPLFSIAFKLMRAKRGFTMLGNDIGKNLVSLARKICPLGDTPTTTFLSEVQKWAERKIAEAVAKGHDNRLSSIADRRECLIAIASECKTVKEVQTTLENMYANSSALLTLSTGHRAKGLEWENVVVLDPWRIPSKFALTSGNAGELEQEDNIRYVIETRAKQKLIFADLANLK